MRSNRVKEISLGYQERFVKGGLQAMKQRKINVLLLRLLRLRLLMEVYLTEMSNSRNTTVTKKKYHK